MYSCNICLWKLFEHVQHEGEERREVHQYHVMLCHVRNVHNMSQACICLPVATSRERADRRCHGKGITLILHAAASLSHYNMRYSRHRASTYTHTHTHTHTHPCSEHSSSTQISDHSPTDEIVRCILSICNLALCNLLLAISSTTLVCTSSQTLQSSTVHNR
jgi:hypothetical protein